MNSQYQGVKWGARNWPDDGTVSTGEQKYRSSPEQLMEPQSSFFLRNQWQFFTSGSMDKVSPKRAWQLETGLGEIWFLPRLAPSWSIHIRYGPQTQQLPRAHRPLRTLSHSSQLGMWLTIVKARSYYRTDFFNVNALTLSIALKCIWAMKATLKFKRVINHHEV